MNTETVVPVFTNAETFTYTTWEEENKGIFIITVKKEFLQNCDPLKTTLQECMTKHDMPKFLHNENGPAFTSTVAKHSEYILNGKKATPEEEERIKHNAKFGNEFDQMLTS